MTLVREHGAITYSRWSLKIIVTACVMKSVRCVKVAKIGRLRDPLHSVCSRAKSEATFWAALSVPRIFYNKSEQDKDFL